MFLVVYFPFLVSFARWVLELTACSLQAVRVVLCQMAWVVDVHVIAPGKDGGSR